MRFAHGGSPGLVHEALLYRDEGELVAVGAPFVRDGLAAGEAVAVLAKPATMEALADALGDAGSAVRFADSADWYDTPARMIASIHDFGEQALTDGATGIRTLGELRFDGTVDEQLGWLQYEALINRVLATTPHWGLCAYDRRELPEWILERAAHAHPVLVGAEGRQPSPGYAHPDGLALELAPPPPAAEGEPLLDLRVSDQRQLAAARRQIDALLRACGAQGERATELAVGLNEIVTNALEHGGASARLRCWQDQRGRLVCEVADEGPGLDDPLAGYSPPDARQIGGRGLWVARQTFDTVALRPNARNGGLLVTLAATV